MPLSCLYVAAARTRTTAQRELSNVVTHGNWLKLHDALHRFDATTTDTIIKNRESSRLVSHSQTGAGAWLDTLLDSTIWSAKQRTTLHTVSEIC